MKKMISYVTILGTCLALMIPSVQASAEEDLPTRIHAIAGQNKKFKGDIKRALRDLSDAEKKNMVTALEIFHPGLESRMDSLVLLGIIQTQQKTGTLPVFIEQAASIQNLLLKDTAHMGSKEKAIFLQILNTLFQKNLLEPALHTLQALTIFVSDLHVRSIYHQTLIKTFLKPLSLLTTWDINDTKALLAHIDPHTKDITVFTVFTLNENIKRYLETLYIERGRAVEETP